MPCCRYRKYKVSADTELVVRCEIDGVLKHKGQDELLSVKALNEFDPKLTGQSSISWQFAAICIAVTGSFLACAHCGCTLTDYVALLRYKCIPNTYLDIMCQRTPFAIEELTVT